MKIISFLEAYINWFHETLTENFDWDIEMDWNAWLKPQKDQWRWQKKHPSLIRSWIPIPSLSVNQEQKLNDLLLRIIIWNIFLQVYQNNLSTF